MIQRILAACTQKQLHPKQQHGWAVYMQNHVEKYIQNQNDNGVENENGLRVCARQCVLLALEMCSVQVLPDARMFRWDSGGVNISVNVLQET